MNVYDIYKNEYGGTIKIFRLCFQSRLLTVNKYISIYILLYLFQFKEMNIV